jgi:hypothetical protein
MPDLGVFCESKAMQTMGISIPLKGFRAFYIPWTK